MSDTLPPVEDSWKSALLAPDIEPLLWPSLRADQISAWHGHVSFGHWLVQATSPNVVVELGTHNGVSFASFCNAAARTGLPTECFAVDTWMGDAHAGSYGNEVYSNLSQFNERNFARSVKLLRCLFDDALAGFDDRSIDILHIDGLHTYEAVSHDFTTWLPKLSDRAIVLFHDTEVRAHDFGVWRLWRELTKGYPHFNFLHSAGLGVLAVGRRPPAPIALLCAMTGEPEATLIRQRFVMASDIAYQNGLAAIQRDRDERLKQIVRGRKNIALNCEAFQSSGHPPEGATPRGGVNGIKNGLFGFHTDFEENPWWMVDLGEGRVFDDVVIYNRLDGPCPERARHIVVLTSIDAETWTELYSHDGSVFGGIDGYPLVIRHVGMRARFLRIRLKGRQLLHLDEIEIYRDR